MTQQEKELEAFCSFLNAIEHWIQCSSCGESPTKQRAALNAYRVFKEFQYIIMPVRFTDNSGKPYDAGA